MEPAATRQQEAQADATFWDARPSLAQIRDFARACRCSPWAVLGVALARVVGVTPPFVMLPPLVGTNASLNLFVALVGPSGSGKGASEGAAADALDLPDLHTATTGSGKGLPHLYAHRERTAGVVRDRDAVLITIPEVDTLTALGSRQGSTLLSVLRSAWSGERLGFSNADRQRTIPIEAHSYRLSLILGVQPARAGALLNDSDGGTPQRFLWLPVTDPLAPEVRPPAPPARQLRRHVWTANAHGRVVLTIPAVAERAIDRTHLARTRGDGDALDGHALLCRLKAAQALTLLDDRQHMNDEDWQLAGYVMCVSRRTRDRVRRELAADEERRNRARGRADGIRALAAEDVVEESSVVRVLRSVLRHLGKTGSMARSDVLKTSPAVTANNFPRPSGASSRPARSSPSRPSTASGSDSRGARREVHEGVGNRGHVRG